MRTLATMFLSFVLLAGRLPAQSAKPDQLTVAFLRSLQNPDGGYGASLDSAGKPLRSSLRATLAATRALRYEGAAPDVAETGRFAARCFHAKTGGFGDSPGEPPAMAVSAVGTMAAVELKLPPESYRDAAIKYLTENVRTRDEMRIAAAAFESLRTPCPNADEWLKQIRAAENADGTFGSGPGLARATGGTAAMILRLGGRLEHRDAILRAMRAGQRADGGFGSADRDGSDLESTYQVMRAFMMLNEPPAAPDKLRAFVAKCRAATGGYGVLSSQPPSAAGTYYAASVRHWLDGQ
jgi:prenyltransferase beta subunit